jgi:surface carbohydrate biosynthesis protein (TIGR04326 family)
VRLREEFKSVVTKLSLANADHKTWWYTWLSSRDRFNSIVWSKLEANIRAELLLAQATDDAEIVTDDPLLVDLITENMRALGWHVSVKIFDRVNWLANKIRNRVKSFVSIFRFLGNSGRWYLAARANRTKSQSDINSADYIFVSVADINSLNSVETFTDHYFGPLPELLAAQDKKVCVVFIPTGNPAGICRALANKQSNVLLTSIAHFMKPGDLLKTLGLAVRGFKFNAQLSEIRPALQTIIKADFKRSVGPICDGITIENAMKRILRLSPKARIVHIYENNPWERAIATAVNTAAAKHEITGYLHCAVLESHIKNFIAAEETKLRPGPDKIICTGPSAREIFLKLGEHNPDRVIAGCALRGQDISALPLRETPPKKIRRVIVIMEGLTSMVQLLKFIHQAAKENPAVDFELREHPALPLATLLPETSIRIGEDANLKVSSPGKIENLFSDYDVALYQGTTAAMTAVAMGLPVIKLALEESVNDDPLINCNSLKKIISERGELVSAFTYFESMSDETFLEQAKDARRYVEDYLAQPTSETLKPFVGNDVNL